MPCGTVLNAAFVREWSAKYPAGNDEEYYYPHLKRGRLGSHDALRSLTEWKNAGKKFKPMCFKKHWRKEKAFNDFCSGLDKYLGENGKARLREDFRKRAPVWSVFWHHVLFKTPILDVYTHMAYHYGISGKLLSKKDAAIRVPKHWEILDKYSEWLTKRLQVIQSEDPSITERMLDRAFVMWGIEQAKTCPCCR